MPALELSPTQGGARVPNCRSRCIHRFDRSCERRCRRAGALPDVLVELQAICRGGDGRKADGRPGAKARRDGVAEAVRSRTARQSATGRRRHVRSDGRSAPGGCGARTRSQQRALGDDSSGPLQFDPTLAAADDNAAEPKKATAAAPATECIALAQALATQASNQASNQATTANELLIARNQQVAANDAPKAEPAPPRVNPALVPVKPKRQAAPVVATVCYVQRDGSCVPSF
jgi:hypothetical protein